jgi:DNA polymerase III alpha subunit
MTKTNKFGEVVLTESDLFDQVMSGADIAQFDCATVDQDVDFGAARDVLLYIPQFVTYNPAIEQLSVEEYDQHCQSHWHMPLEYRNLDIAQHVLSLCRTDAELQRVGQELLMYQERNLFDLLRYLKYLVDTMQENRIIWGVGRGSSLASYVLYLLGVHRIDSMLYDLDPAEFLR